MVTWFGCSTVAASSCSRREWMAPFNQEWFRRASDPEVTRVGCARCDLLAATAFLFLSFTSIWPTAVRLGPLMAVAWLVLVVSLLCPMGWAQQDVIVDVRVSGNRRIPADTIKA